MILAGYPQRTLVAYPISGAELRRGRSLTNWIACRQFSDRTLPPKEDWSRFGRLEDFADAYESWTFEWLDVPAMMRASPGVLEFPMIDRDPLTRWTIGRVTLLGDAAHPMYPIGSNGATQAILDASVLAECLAAESACENALQAYEEQRRTATGRIVLANREYGPDRVLDIVEKRAPDGFREIHDVIGAAEMKQISDDYARITGLSSVIAPTGRRAVRTREITI
jgi:hypothetical protein